MPSGVVIDGSTVATDGGGTRRACRCRTAGARSILAAEMRSPVVGLGGRKGPAQALARRPTDISSLTGALAIAQGGVNKAELIALCSVVTPNSGTSVKDGVPHTCGEQGGRETNDGAPNRLGPPTKASAGPRGR